VVRPQVDTRLFPEEGCVVRGNSALCTVPIAVSEGGFNFQGSTTLGVRCAATPEKPCWRASVRVDSTGTGSSRAV